jgi:hypothetical protein
MAKGTGLRRLAHEGGAFAHSESAIARCERATACYQRGRDRRDSLDPHGISA